METSHHRRVRSGYAVSKRLGSISGGDAGSVQQIFAAPWDAVQRAAIFARRDFSIGLLRLRQRQVARQSDDAMQLRVKSLESLQIDVSKSLGSKLSSLNPSRELVQRSEGDVLITRR